MSNKKAKEELIKYYGAECFIDKLHLRKDATPRKYKGKGQKARMKQLTFHHIKMKKDGGASTKENGALLSAENHIWFHKQNENAQKQMNKIFQEYKKQMDECRIEFVDELNLSFEVHPIEFSIDEKDIEKCNQEKEKYNRAKKKQEDRKLTEEYIR